MMIRGRGAHGEEIDPMQKIRKLIRSERFRELFVYLVVGVLTTVVNYVAYFIVTRGGSLISGVAADHWLMIAIAKVVAWILAVAFAFWANKKYVFRSDDWSRDVLRRELPAFVSARILSLGIDMGFVQLAVQSFHMNDLVATLIANVIVVVANYFASKLWIFKRKAR